MKIISLDKLLKRPTNHVGIDIGSYAVKAVEVFKKKNICEIKNISYVRVENPDLRDSVLQAVKESVARINTPRKEVNVAISGPSAIVRFIELPRMTEDELRNAIFFEAEKYIPFSAEEVIIDHQLLIPRLSDENKMLVLLVAARKDLITERLNLLNEAGLSARVLDVAAFANINAFLLGTERKEGDIAAIVDIGAKATDINIMDGDVLYFTRSIQLGGNDITKVLSNEFSIDLNSAEDIKLNPAERAAEVEEKIKPVLNNIIDEIRLSFSYYENLSGKSIEKVFLAGGGSKVINFYNMLKENLGIELRWSDPTQRLQLGPAVDSELVNSVKEQLGVAIGLALR